MDRLSGSVPSLVPVADPAQAGDPQQPGDPFPADPDPHPEPQLGMDPGGSVGTARHGVDVDDGVRQISVLEITCRGWSVAPLVVARPRDLQDPAGHRDVEAVVGELLDQPEPYSGSTFSGAK